MLLSTVACLVLAAWTSHAGAATAVGSSPLPPAFYLSGFGTSEVYRGQTFIVPAGEPLQADRVSVFFATNTSPDASFRVLITAVERSPGLHPTQVLFESETYTLPILGGDQEIAVDLGGLLLTPGVEYAWIVDHFVVAPAMGNTSMSLGLGEYVDGQSFQFPNGPFLPGGTRQDHFASNGWMLEPDGADGDDFAFEIEFSEPVAPARAVGVDTLQPLALLILVFGMMALASLHSVRAK